MRIKEILKTDSLAGSRILINNNFKNTKTEVEKLEKYFDFEGVGLIYHNDDESTPINYVNSKEIITNKIQGNESFIIYKDELPCIKFNGDGHLIIRKDSSLNLDLQAKLEELASNRVDVAALTNEVEQRLKQDPTLLTDLTTSLKNDNEFINTIVTKVINSPAFTDKVIRLIEQYGPTPTPTTLCNNFSIYAKNNILWLHCNREQTSEHDMKLVDYEPAVGDTITLSKADIISIIDDYYDPGGGDALVITYTDERLQEKPVAVNDTQYVDYGADGQGPESWITAYDLGTENETYKITVLRLN